jgi:glycosyltransferase involved in cell wall biosynthesis
MNGDRDPHWAIFLPSFAGGGAERVMVQLAVALHQQELPVELWLAQARGPYLADVPPGVPVRELGGAGVLRSLLPLVGCLRRRRPQVLLAAMTHANVVALLAVVLAVPRGRGRPRVVISERAAPGALLRAEGPLQEAVLRLLMRWLYPSAAAVISVSEGVAAELHDLVRLPVTRIKAIANPIDVPALRTAAAQALPHPWLQAGQPPLLMAAGRLVEQKDFQGLLQALALVRQQHPARLVILGEGPLRPRLQAQSDELGLADAVLLPGFVANPMAWMARAAVFVLSSRWEGLPGVLLQAMACGAPVVSTDCPHGPREILEDGRWGELVPVGDAAALAAAITRQLASPAAQLPAGGDLRPASPRCAAYAPERIWQAYRQVLEG